MKIIPKRSRYSICLLCLLFLFPSTAKALDASPRQKITVAHWGKEKILLYLPLYLAEEEGLFEKRGIEISIRYSGNDDQVFASVMSGEADVGIGDPIFAAIAHERGFPGKVIALLVRKLGISGYTNSDRLSGMLDREGVKGLRIGSFPAPSTTYTLLSRFAREYPNQAEAPRIVQLAIGAQAAGLASGDVDIATDLEPAVSLAEASGKKVVFSLDSYSKPLAITGITTSEKILTRRKRELEGFVSALDEALLRIQQDPVRTKEVAQKVFPRLEKAVVDKAVSRLLQGEAFPHTTEIPSELWNDSLRIRKESGELRNEEAARTVIHALHTKN